MTEPTATAAVALATARPGTAGRWALRVAIALAGALIAVLLFARISAPIGPFDATLAFRPAGGGAQVALPPLGALTVDVYDGPLRLDIQLQRVDQVRAQALASDPVQLAGVVDQVSADLRGAVVALVWMTAARRPGRRGGHVAGDPPAPTGAADRRRGDRRCSWLGTAGSARPPGGPRRSPSPRTPGCWSTRTA